MIVGLMWFCFDSIMKPKAQTKRVNHFWTRRTIKNIRNYCLLLDHQWDEFCPQAKLSLWTYMTLTLHPLKKSH
jgi:hypothetical protein